MIIKGKTRQKREIVSSFVALVTLAWLFVGGGTVLEQDVVRILIRHHVIANISSSETSVSIDWKSLYPFKDWGDEREQHTMDIGTEDSMGSETGIKDDSDNSPGAFNKLEYAADRLKYHLTNAEQYFPFSRNLLELSGYIKRATGITDFGGSHGVVKLNNGYLGYVERKKTETELDEAARNLSSFEKWLENRGIRFIFVQYPLKNSKYDIQIPSGIMDYANENRDHLISILDSNGIPILDLREDVVTDGISHYDMFYMTDNHWKTSTGIWAAQKVGEEINKRYGACGFDLQTDLCSVDIKDGLIVPDEKLYERTVYEKSLLGFEGAKVTLGYVNPEDFEMYSPIDDGRYHCLYPDIRKDLTGRFDDTMYDAAKLQFIDLYDSNPYAALLYGLRPLSILKNKDCFSDRRVLIIEDSFILAFAPYFSQMVRETHLIDTRPLQGNFTGSIRSYVEEMHPDLVIVMCDVLSGGYSFK